MNVAGIWKVQMKYLCGEGSQRFLLEQQEGGVTGVYIKARSTAGNLDWQSACATGEFAQRYAGRCGNEIHYVFSWYSQWRLHERHR